MCTELSGIWGVTYYPETLARKKPFLVFCMFLCNLEQTVLSFTFSLLGKKKNKKQTSALFLIAVLIYVPFLFF